MDEITTAGAGDRGRRTTRRGGDHRRTIAVAAAVSLTALVGGALAQGADGGDGTLRPTTPTTPVTAPPALRTATMATVAASATVAAVPAMASHAGPAADTGRPTDPARYATAAFDAWLQGNDGRLRTLATAPVAEFMAAITADGTSGWSGPVCEGVAGATSCTWAGTDAHLTLRVADEAATPGRRHAVTQASFTPPPGGVAVWPFTTAEQAAETQAAFDEGHQPWLYSPEDAALTYASAELGWPGAVIDSDDPGAHTRYRLTDPESLTLVDVTMAQPARQGAGGIWAVVRLVSAD